MRTREFAAAAIVGTLAAFTAVAEVVPEGNILKNPGFEEGYKEWRKSGKAWRVEDGAGYGGTKGLVWETATPVKRAYPAQSVKLEAGCAYRLTALVKVDKLKGAKGPSVGFEWFDVNGKWVSGVRASPVDDNGALKDGWLRYECTTRVMKPTDARGGVLCMLTEGSTGKVRFDDVTFECVQLKMIEYICTSAYRDSAADGELRVLASLNVSTNSIDASLSVKTADGGTRTLAPIRFEEDIAVFTMPVSSLAMGSQKFVFSLTSRKDGKTVDTKEIAFERTAPGAGRRRVSFDGQGRMLLDGRKFFPLGHYTGSLSPEEMAEYKRGPYNFAIQYGAVTTEQLDRYQAAGVYVASDVRKMIYGYNFNAHRRGLKTMEDSRKALRKCYKEIGSHPALVMWYLNDEAPVSMVPNTTAVNEFLHSIDPDRATITCLCDPRTPREFMPSYDVMAHDCYPIGNKVGKSMLERVTRQMRVVADRMAGMRPLWFIPQTFDWRWCYSKESLEKCDKPYLRMPTREEMANMTWQGIACGANGIVSYSFSTIRRHAKGAEYEKAWGDTCSVAFEVKLMEDVLLADDVTARFKKHCASLPKYLPVRFYSHDGRTWMLAVNATREAMRAGMPLPAKCTDFKTRLGGGVACASDGRSLSLDLPPLGYAFVSFVETQEVCDYSVKDLGAEREVMWDMDRIASLGGGASLRLHSPEMREVAISHDEPWEGNTCCYHTILRDNVGYKMYYRGSVHNLPGRKNHQAVCYAESDDGITWRKPKLGICTWNGSKDNNLILLDDEKMGKYHVAHNFTAFFDTRSDCPREERYKAVGGSGSAGLWGLVSPDGIHWKLLDCHPLMTSGAFDSQNTVFWDEDVGAYVAYFRAYRHGLRGIKRLVSSSFRNWGEDSQWGAYDTESPDDQLYTNAIRPYERAKGVYVGFPKRFTEGRSSCYDKSGSGGIPGVSDGVFMSSRDGIRFKRWSDAFIRPGLQHERWVNRNNMTAWGYVVTKSATAGCPDEISIYSTENYYAVDGSTRLRRMTVRLDGFASVHAPWLGGSATTKPLVFSATGEGPVRLLLNASTSGAGYIRCEIRGADGEPVPGFSLADSAEIFGDEIELAMAWKGGSDLRRLAGCPVTLHFEMKDADIYSYRFGK
ncbi:MAG: hypothetical protein IKO72_00700 [Kiritimatiellae bacterium]|nr:hypothetical protein [Kiritimatiellia bacterium]